MAEFTQTMSGDSRYSIKLTVTEVVPSDYVTTNKTNVNYTLTATKSGGSGYWNNNANNPVKVTINGTDVVNTNVAYDFRNATPKTITLATGTVTGIEHNADGSKTIAVSGYFKDNGNSLGSATASGSLTLTTIPRASQPSVDELYGDLGTTFTVRTNRASNSFTHTLKFKVGSTQIGSDVTGVGDTYSWTPTIAAYAPYRPDGQYVIATVECITFNGGTNLGTKSTSVQLFIPQITSGANKTTPDCSISIQEDNATMKTLNWGVYVRGKSQLKVTITGTPKFSTTMDTYSSNANGSAYSGSFSGSGQQSKSYTTNTLTGDGSVTATVKDKRNYSSSQASQSYTTQSYSNPQITTSQVYRCDSNGNQNDSGTYIKYIFGGSISSVSNKNSKTFTLKWKPKNGSDTTVGTWTDSYTCNKNGILSGFSTSTEYIFTFTATDSFTSTSVLKEIGTEPDIMNFNASGKSMAIGGISQRGSSDKYLDVYTNTDHHNVVIYEEPILGHRISSGGGTSGYFYICDITHSGTYSQQFVEFTFMQRSRYGKMILRLTGSSTAGAIAGVEAGWVSTNSDDIKTYYLLSNNKVQLYIQKQQGWDDLEVYVKKGHYEDAMNIVWVNQTVASLPSGASEIYGMTSRINITGSAALASSASSATNATNNSSGQNLITTYSRAGHNVASSFDDIGSGGKLQRSGLYSESIGDIWYNIINVRHRNGEGDGVYYGMQFRSAMTTNNVLSAQLQYRNNYGKNSSNVALWTGWQTVLTNNYVGSAMLTLSSNYSFSGATTWTNTVVPLSGRSTLTNSNSNLFEQSSNGIKCKFNGWVQVTGTVCNDKTNEFDAVILKGTTQVIRQINTAGKQSLASTIVQVANGDVINLGFYTGNSSGTIYNNSNLIVTRIS